MKCFKFITVAAASIFLTVSMAYAAPDTNSEPHSTTVDQKQSEKEVKGKGWREEFAKEMQKDPVKALESKKQRIQTLLKEGKISREKADTITAKLDTRIKEVKEFDKLSVQQKKELLKSNFKARIEAKVREGKLTQDQASTILKKHEEKIEKWDGQGYPQFQRKCCKKHKAPEQPTP